MSVLFRKSYEHCQFSVHDMLMGLITDLWPLQTDVHTVRRTDTGGVLTYDGLFWNALGL
jgi:hypothetical protein